ncbi:MULTISPECIES: hypothetical protein [unclassified Cryobacterium]|uniref:hypothetical protein n=1 Tax=unclassified Cryobacterium TaxID=2649013 RepID=UPI001069715E|nr:MULTISPECIES: hypothetical protein [unclassified Cryobacterium]TFC58165.1 hypothetical protein E3O60_12155 [Cryobacterium sp. TMB1-7]TFC89272.1 hypothetical protein E3T19_08765 [Cryobacterium sp. TMT4-31]
MTRTIPSSAPGTLAARQAVAALQLRHPAGRATRSTYTQQPRREIPSSWSVVAIALASVIIAGCLYFGAELVLALLDRPALIAAPGDVLRYLGQVNLSTPVMVILVAGVGTVLVLAALLPERQERPEVEAITYDSLRPTLLPTVMIRRMDL